MRALSHAGYGAIEEGARDICQKGSTGQEHIELLAQRNFIKGLLIWGGYD